MNWRVQALGDVRRGLRAFISDRCGSSAVEFAIVSLPFLLVLLLILQMSIFYMTQSALDTGIVQSADTLVNAFNSTGTPTIPDLRALVVSKGGGMVQSSSSGLYVELQPFANLTAAPVAITNTVNAGSARSLLALRAQTTVPTFFPGATSLLVVRSSALIRRQGQ